MSDTTTLITYIDLHSKIQLHKAEIYALKNIYKEYKVDDEIRRWNEVISIANDPFIKAKAKHGLCNIALEIFMKGDSIGLDIRNLINEGLELIKTSKKEHTLKCDFKHPKKTIQHA